METPKIVQEKKPEPQTHKKDEKPKAPESGVSYKMAPVDEIPKRTFFRGSRYYSILEDFIKNPPPKGISKIENLHGKEGNYIASQITKQLKSHALTDKVKVSCVGGVVYLEIKKPIEKKA
jgi:hypothetical protein